MYVLHRPDKPITAFILPPKTGTRSVEHVLAAQVLAKKYGGRHAIDQTWVDKAEFVASTIRNPFDVLVSWYCYHGGGRKKGRTFGEWLEWIWEDSSRNRHLEYSTLPGAEHATHTIRFESGLQPELNAFLEVIPLPPIRMEHIHVGASPDRLPYQVYYTPELVDRVRTRYAADFERFGYEFEGKPDA